MPHFVGLDIGGANLKAAHVDGQAASVPFAVWKHPEQLGNALSPLLARFERIDALAVTMTAELADCFETKSEGVSRILDSVAAAADSRPVHVWQTGGEFVAPDVARDIPRLVAAANWHALATWVGTLAPSGAALLIDIGTTTTDIIPLSDGLPASAGATDVDRLLSGELVYTGVRRTPLCAMAPQIPFRGRSCPIAAELFATTLDVHLILGNIPEDATDLETANGRPATIAAAHDRLARMLCCDRDEFTLDDARAAAAWLADAQQRQITAAIDQVLAAQETCCGHVIVSGSGAFLAERVVSEHSTLSAVKRTRLADLVPPGVSEAACAFAVARLAAERILA